MYKINRKFNRNRQGTKIEWRYTEDGQHVRVSVRTGRVIPIPVSAMETRDYKIPALYKEQPKDTTKKEVMEVTFEVCNFYNSVTKILCVKM